MYCTKLGFNGVYEKNTSVPTVSLPPQLSERPREENQFSSTAKCAESIFRLTLRGLIPKQYFEIIWTGYPSENFPQSTTYQSLMPGISATQSLQNSPTTTSLHSTSVTASPPPLSLTANTSKSKTRSMATPFYGALTTSPMTFPYLPLLHQKTINPGQNISHIFGY